MTVATDKRYTVTADREGGMLIPSPLLLALGWAEGDWLDIRETKGSIYLTKASVEPLTHGGEAGASV